MLLFHKSCIWHTTSNCVAVINLYAYYVSETS